MYLTKITTEQIGPFEKLVTIDLPFDETGRPKPIIFVGKNGAGKTTLLAHIVDALHEFGADHYCDLLPQDGFDDAFDAWNSGVNGGTQKWTVDSSATEEKGLLAAHPTQKGFLALLPVPAFRAQFAAQRFGGDSCVSIELLFPDVYLTDCVRTYDLPGGGKTLEFKANKKTEFAAKISQFPIEAFDGFKPVFTMLDDIITGKRPVKILPSSSALGA